MKKHNFVTSLLLISLALILQSDVIAPSRIHAYEKRIFIHSVEKFPQYSLIAIERSLHGREILRFQRVRSGVPLQKTNGTSRIYLIACPSAEFDKIDTLSMVDLEHLMDSNLPVLLEDFGVRQNTPENEILGHDVFYNVFGFNHTSLIITKEMEVIQYPHSHTKTIYAQPKKQ